MKRFIYFSMITLMLVSCTKTNENSTSNIEILSQETITTIGKEHNLALGSILDKLKKNQKIIIDLKSTESIIFEGLSNFYSNESSFKDNAAQLNKSTKTKLNQLYSNKLIQSKYTESVQEIISYFNEHLSSQQINYLLELESILNDNEINIEKTLDHLSNLERDAKENLKIEEAQIIVVGIEVAKNSSVFWNENIYIWNETLNSTPIQRNWFSWKDVVKGDAYGAIMAACSTYYANVVVGAGQVAYGSAILGGAVIGSIGNALEQAFNQL